MGSDESRGDLSLCWKQGCLVSLLSFSMNHIDVLIEDDSDGNRWRFTGIYGFPEEAYRWQS